MKKIMASAAGIISTAILLAPSIATAKFSLSPYGGIDVGMQNIGFKTGYGDNLFAKHLPKANFFAGLKFNDYFGIEGGYETTIKKTKKNASTGYNENYLGYVTQALLPGERFSSSNSMKVTGWHIGITGEYPLYSKTHHKLSVIGYLGTKNTRVKLTSNIYNFAGVSTAINCTLNNNNTKQLIKAHLGFQYFLHEHFGVRALMSWENSSKIKPNGINSNNRYLQANLKNSVGYSIGIIFKK